MQVREWFRPPHRLLVGFLVVALVSAAAFGWLGVLLFDQDNALEAKQQQERIEQAADRAVAVMQRSLAALQDDIESRIDPDQRLPPGTLTISVESNRLSVRPHGSLLFVPIVDTSSEAPAQYFVEGERLEFASADLAGAAREYARLADASEVSLRAEALVRLARVFRRQHNVSGALGAYGRLQEFDRVTAGGLPASLLARVGRASVYLETGRTTELRAEADALQKDLFGARWPLMKAQFDFYSDQAVAWSGTTPVRDADARARADAVDWLWHSRGVEQISRRSVGMPSGPVFLSWIASPNRLIAVIAGPAYLQSLCAEAIGPDFGWTLIDREGRTLLGSPPPMRGLATRTAAASGLPWSLDVFAAPNSPIVSPRRPLLVLLFALVALVLVTGWYFIVRAMSRELRVSRLQSDFVAAVSHEFRSPLTSLAHIAAMLEEDRFPSDDVRRKAFSVLVRETDRLRQLVEGLLDFGRFEAGAATLRLETFDIVALVRATVDDFQERAIADGYTIELTAPDTAIEASVDREAISRALWNLLDNAVKYSPECRTVWVVMTHARNRISIDVRDRGLGIPLHEQREVFDRFVRGRESKARRIKGTGIGLAMVRQIVHAHGGTVQVQSQEGAGSTFAITLPRAETLL